MLCEISINNLIYEVIKEQNIDCLNKKFLICCDFVKIFFFTNYKLHLDPW